MPIVISLGSWQFWAVVFVVIIFIMWLFWGGRRDIEVQGLEPLQAPLPPPGRVTPPPPAAVWGMPPSTPPPPYTPSPPTLVSLPPEGVVRPQPVSYNPPAHHPQPISYTPPHHLQDGASQRFVVGCLAHRPSEGEVEAKSGRPPSMGERLTCQALAALLGGPVEQDVKMDHLYNPKTGNYLRYDCWHPGLRVAVEYDGVQHGEYNPHFHRGDEANFEDQKYRDRLKNKLSLEHGISLIRIPHTVDTCDPDPYSVNGYRLNRRIKEPERYQRIYAHLSQELTRLGIIGVPISPTALAQE